MTASARRRRPGGRALLVLLALSTVLAFSWDADGNPNTDNLPMAVLAVADGAAEEVAGDRRATPVPRPPARPWRMRRLRSLWSPWRLDLWRATAAPPRGP